MKDIPNYNTFEKIEQIFKGWSGDRKYYIETRDGEQLLLRISNISAYKEKQQEFEVMKKISSVGIKMSMPISFGICENGNSVYQLLSWCEGVEAKEALSRLSNDKQYLFGQYAASILKKMETVSYTPASYEWSKNYQKKVESYIKLYRECGYTFEDDELIIDYLQTKHNCIGERPTALLHSDFQTDNMVISSNGELYIIDFQMCGIVDPYLVMTGVGVSAMYSIPFAKGQIDGYFGNTIPTDFWEKYRYYMLAEMLYAFTVGVKMDDERDDTLSMFNDEVDRIKHNGSLIPDWYKNNL